MIGDENLDRVNDEIFNAASAILLSVIRKMGPELSIAFDEMATATTRADPVMVITNDIGELQRQLEQCNANGLELARKLTLAMFSDPSWDKKVKRIQRLMEIHYNVEIFIHVVFVDKPTPSVTSSYVPPKLPWALTADDRKTLMSLKICVDETV